MEMGMPSVLKKKYLIIIKWSMVFYYLLMEKLLGWEFACFQLVVPLAEE
jgi:hypothetical protein